MVRYLAFLLLCASAMAEIIPADRVVDWAQAGLLGGIPERTNIFCDVTQEIPGTNILAVADGVTDDSVAIQTAINLCPSNEVVYIPAGNYKIGKQLSVGTKSNWILRGAGTNTILNVDLTNSSLAFIYVGQREYPLNTNRIAQILYGADKGATNIVLGSVPLGLSAGKTLLINQLNDETNMVTSIGSTGAPSTFTDRDKDGSRSLQELVMITDISDDTNVTFWPPLVWNYDTNNLSPEATYQPYIITNVGIEDLKIVSLSANAAYHIFFSAVAYCWVYNVESDSADSRHFYFTWDLGCEIRQCYIHDAFNFTVGKGYGFDSFITSRLRIEDNIFEGLYSTFILTASAGSVVGYNFVTNTHNSDPTMLMGAFSASHGAHGLMCLFEGNKGATFKTDYYWGSSSHMTLFRNHFTGDDAGITQFKRAVQLDRYSLSNNVVGNVLGHAGETNWTYQTTNDAWSYHSPVIYRLGYPNMGNYDYDDDPSDSDDYDEFDARVADTVIRHGNFDYSGQAVVWDESIEDTNIVDSLYLEGKPTWFGSLTWPPIGSDLSPMSSTIPAEARYLGESYEGITLTWAGSTNITYPAPWTNSATATFGTNTVEGEFTYSITNDTVLTVGAWTNTVSFTPTDTNEYSAASITVRITVAQGDPGLVVTNLVSSVTYPVAFATNMVYAYSLQPSVITYSPAPGTALTPGSTTITITCTPTNANYATVTDTASLTVTGTRSGVGTLRLGGSNPPIGRLLKR